MSSRTHMVHKLPHTVTTTIGIDIGIVRGHDWGLGGQERDRASKNWCLRQRRRRQQRRSRASQWPEGEEGAGGCARTQPRPAFIYYATRGALGAGNARRGGGRIPGGRRRNAAKITRTLLPLGPASVSIESHFKINEFKTYSGLGNEDASTCAILVYHSCLFGCRHRSHCLKLDVRVIIRML